jgi:hypothetical protein
MNRLIRPAAVAAWLLLSVFPLYVLTRGQDTEVRPALSNRNVGGYALSNSNGNMNTGVNGNMNSAAGGGASAGAWTAMNGNMSWRGPFTMNRNVGPDAVAPDADEAEADEVGADAPANFTAEWDVPGETWGNVSKSPLVLRSGPGADSPVTARVAVEEGAGVRILAVEGESLRVRVEANAEPGGARKRDVEGWAAWGAVTPSAYALVLDAAGGEVLERIPLDGGVTSVLFAPDGATALFHGAGTVVEADAEEFKPRRALTLNGAVTTGEPFWQGGAGRLVVPAWRVSNNPSGNYTLDFLCVGVGPETSVATGITATFEGRFLVSSDGRTGFAIYQSGAAWGLEGVISVVAFDLQTLAPARNFTLPEAVTWDDEIIVGPDGAELLVIGNERPQRLVAVETMTGSIAREIPLGLGQNGWASFAQTPCAGGPLYLRVSAPSESGRNTVGSARLGPEGKISRVAAGVAFVAEAGGTLYGVSDVGTRLFTLDANHRVRSARDIKGHEAGPPVVSDEKFAQAVLGLFAAPDGKRLVVIMGVPECGC